MKRINFYLKYSNKRYLSYLRPIITTQYNQTNYYNYYLISSIFIGLTTFGTIQLSQCDEKSTKIEIIDNAPGVHDGLPIISRAEVTRHKTVETRIWTTFKNGY